MAKRKRRPGGGRKPGGEFPAKTMTFTTRIQPSTRRALEEAAKARPDGSISAAAEFILKAGLQRPSAVPRNNAIGAAIVLLAESIESATGFGWLDDQWTGMALRYAIEHLLFWYAPTPDDNFPVPVAINAAANKMPPEFAERFRKPAGFGHTMADRLIHEIQQATSPGPINEWSLPIFLSGRPAQLRLIGRDLGIAQTKKGRAK